MKIFNRLCGPAAPLVALLACFPASTWALPMMGAELTSFAVLGAAAVTNTGPTTLIGGLGVSNNSSPSGITGFFGTMANDGPGTAIGAIHQGNAYALSADGQLVNAMTTLSLMGPGTTLGASLDGLTLASGVYTVLAGITNLTGTLTLDGGGNANAFWVFQMPSTLITSAGSVVNVINTGAGAGVYWNIGSSATLGANTTFEGNLLASASITFNDGVNLSCGRALAHTGAVTMMNDRVDAVGCVGTGEEGSQGLSGGLTGFGPGTPPIPLPVVPAIPEPETWALMLAGLGALRWAVASRRAQVR